MGVLSPVDQRKIDSAEFAVRSTLSPSQKLVAPEAVIEGAAGRALIVMVVAVEGRLVQVFPSLTCTL